MAAGWSEATRGNVVPSAERPPNVSIRVGSGLTRLSPAALGRLRPLLSEPALLRQRGLQPVRGEGDWFNDLDLGHADARSRETEDAEAARGDRWLALVRFAMLGGYLGLGCQVELNLRFHIDAPIGTEKPIPEIVDYRKIAIGVPVVEKMELLLSPEPCKSSQP